MSWVAVSTGKRLELSGSILESDCHSEEVAIRGCKKLFGVGHHCTIVSSRIPKLPKTAVGVWTTLIPHSPWVS
jgi:hypothetical protein